MHFKVRGFLSAAWPKIFRDIRVSLSHHEERQTPPAHIGRVAALSADGNLSLSGTRHHIIISGTGRAGTTFLVQLLTQLGLDTGFADPFSHIFANCNAGMEWDMRHPGAPYVLKDPWLCDYLSDVLQEGGVCIDHAIIPVRDLFSAAESRRDVTQRTDLEPYQGNVQNVPGGLWHTARPEQQEAVLAQQLYKLIYTLAQHEIPLTLLHFPRFIHDPSYLHGKLGFMLPVMSYASFLEAFHTVVQPELVHEFKPN
jgi:hypothetical protein